MIREKVSGNFGLLLPCCVHESVGSCISVSNIFLRLLRDVRGGLGMHSDSNCPGVIQISQSLIRLRRCAKALGSTFTPPETKGGLFGLNRRELSWINFVTLGSRGGRLQSPPTGKGGDL